MVTEAQLIERTREAGRKFLRENPSAFGGGIDPKTGVRSSGGKRISVAGAGEVAGTGGVPTLQEARTISKAGEIAKAQQLERERQFAIAREQSRIEAERQRIISEGGRVSTQQSIDAQTREQLKITTTRGKKGTRIFEVENLETGKKTIKTFEKQKGRKDVVQTGGLIIQEVKTVTKKEVEVKGPINLTREEREKFITDKLAREGNGFRIGLSKQEERLTTEDIIKGRFKEVGEGAVSAIGGLLEGTINLAGSFGVQTIELDKQGRRIDKSFRFSDESFFGRARAKQTGTGKILGQALVIAPLIGGGIAAFSKGVSQVGLKETITETVTSFTPLKIPTQTFGALEVAGAADKLKFDVVSFKTTKGDITTRVVVGSAKGFRDVSLLSKQVIGKVGDKSIGFAVTDISAPTTTFRSGKFIEGIRAIRTESIIIPQKAGAASIIKNFRRGITASQVLGKGGVSKVFTRAKINLALDESGKVDVKFINDKFKPGKIFGEVSNVIDDLTSFAGGKGSRVDIITKESILKKVRVKDINIKGVELDISKFGDRQQFGAGGFVSDKSTGVGTKQVVRQLSAAISELPKPEIIPKVDTSFVVPTVTAIVTKKTQTQTQKPLQVLSSKQRPTTTQEEISITKVISLLDFKPKSLIETRSTQGVRTIQQPIQQPIEKPIEKPIEIPRQITEPGLQLEPVTTISFAGFPASEIVERGRKFKFKISKELRTRRRIREVETFSVEVKRRGEFGAIRTDLTLSQALRLGKRRTKKTLARTFRISRTGRKKQVGGIDEEFEEVDLTGFRQFRQVKGRRRETPFTFIQTAPTALGTRSERIAIQKARRQSAQLNKLIGM